MKIVGLTGGIACGKSTVSAWLRRREIAVVDLDEIVRRLQKPRTRVVYELGRSFPGVVDADGCLDRGKLGSLIFNDAAQRRKLNVLMRGHILRAMGLELLGHFLCKSLINEQHIGYGLCPFVFEFLIDETDRSFDPHLPIVMEGEESLL